MDGSHFDALARSVRGGPSRRSILSGLGVALGLVAFRVPGTVEARKKRKKKRKKKCSQPCVACQKCVKGKCKPAVGAPCGPGGECLANGSCAVICPVTACDAGCLCGFASVEGPMHCIVSGGACLDWPECSSSAGCPQGQHCQAIIGCGDVDRCVPLCPA